MVVQSFESTNFVKQTEVLIYVRFIDVSPLYIGITSINVWFSQLVEPHVYILNFSIII